MLYGLSKTLLAFLLITGGVLFIVWSNPPHTICEVQLTDFQNSMANRVFSTPKVKIPIFKKALQHCQKTNTPGGCMEMLSILRQLIRDLTNLSSECIPAAASLSPVLSYMNAATEIIARIGWGEKKPQTAAARYGWLDTSDVFMFCNLKKAYTQAYGEEKWNTLQHNIMQNLPEAKKVSASDLWTFSVFSTRCESYSPD